MGFNLRKMEDERRRVAEKEAAARRATDLLSPTIDAAITARCWYLWVCCQRAGPSTRSIYKRWSTQSRASSRHCPAGRLG
jgi:hypothetical protein